MPVVLLKFNVWSAPPLTEIVSEPLPPMLSSRLVEFDAPAVMPRSVNDWAVEPEPPAVTAKSTSEELAVSLRWFEPSYDAVT